MRFVRVLDHNIEGLDTLRADRGVVMVANHPTLLDYVLLAAYVPDLDCIVKSALLKNPFLSGVVKSADYLINSDDPELLMKACQERLDAGGVILIFPEGTRTRRHTPVKLQRGAANIALRCQSNLRLVKIWCVPPVVLKEQRWYQAPKAKPTLFAQAKEQIMIEDFLTNKTQTAQPETLVVRKLNDYLTARLAPFKICTFGSS